MIPIADALAIVAAHTEKLPSETVALPDALGRVLAQDIVADTDLPPFDRAQMDGYAVRAADVACVPARLQIVGEAAAGRGWHHTLHDGQAVRIMTGAPVPTGADSVQKVEVTRENDDSATVEIDEATHTGQNIVLRASEIRTGQTVLRAGQLINAASLAALASFGYAQVRVGARPRVAVLATGSELVAVKDTPGPDEIRDSNTYTLAAYATLAGATVTRWPLADDEPAALRATIAQAAAQADVVVLSGGVSMGRYDYTKTALRELGTEIFFEKVALRPGKPTVFGKLGKVLMFGLPGNPVSVAVTFNLFVRLALLGMQGATQTRLPESWARLARRVKSSAERDSYLPATLDTNEHGQLYAEPLRWGGSSDFIAFTQATALIAVPANTGWHESGALVRVTHLP